MNHLAFKEALELLRDPQSLKRLKEHDAFPDAAQLSSTDRLFLVTDASKPPPGPEGPMYYVERMPLAPGDDANGVAAALVTRLFKPSTVRLADGHEWRVSVREYRLLENVMLSPAEQKMRHMPISVRIQAAKGDVADLEDVDGERHLLAVTAASGKGYEFSSTRLCGTSRPEGGGSRTLSLAPTAWWKSAGVDTVPLKLPNKNAPLELSKFVPRSVWRRTSAVTLYSRNLSRGAGEPVGWFASAAMPARSPPAARESPSSGREAGAEWEACDVIAKRLVSDLLASSTDAPPARGDSPPTSADASGCAAELAAHVERLEAQLQESAARLELVEAELVQQRQEATRLRQDKEALEGELSRAKRARADGPSDAPEGPQDERAPPQPRDDADGGDGDDRRRPAQAKALHRVEGQTLRRDDRVSAAAPPPPIPLTLYGGGPLPSVSPTDASWAETALARARAGAAGGAGEAVQSGGDAPPSGAVVVEEEAWPLLSARAEPKSELDAWCAAHGLPPPTYEAEALPTHTSRWLVRVHVASGPSAPAIFRTPPAAERRFKREAVAEAARVALERIDAHAAAEHFDSTRFRQVLPSAAARAQEDDLAREFQRCLRLIPRATSAAQSAAAPAAEGGHGDADASQGPAARAPAELERWCASYGFAPPEFAPYAPSSSAETEDGRRWHYCRCTVVVRRCVLDGVADTDLYSNQMVANARGASADDALQLSALEIVERLVSRQQGRQLLLSCGGLRTGEHPTQFKLRAKQGSPDIMGGDRRGGQGEAEAGWDLAQHRLSTYMRLGQLHTLKRIAGNRLARKVDEMRLDALLQVSMERHDADRAEDEALAALTARDAGCPTGYISTCTPDGTVTTVFSYD